METRALVLGTLVVVAALAGASGPVDAQTDDDLVTLTIEVVNPSSNERLGQVSLVATWDGGTARATTTSNGRAFVDVPQGATVEITLDDDEYTRNEPYRIRVATEKEHTVEASRKAELDVVVSDAEGPVSDARVVLRQGDLVVASGRTDAEGRFQSGTIAQGQYTLSAVRSGYYRTSRQLVVAGSPETTVTIERGRVDYTFAVEDPRFTPAEPVSNATVSVERVGDLRTDERGGAAALLPVNSQLQVEVSKEGYETTTRTITVNESRGSATFALSRSPSLSLTTLNQQVVVGELVAVEVTDAYGDPASGVAILLDGERVAETGDDGRVTVRIEEPGAHELRARRGGTTSGAVTVTGVTTAAERTGTTTAASTATPTGTPTSSVVGPGFGPLVALVALAGALVVLARGRGRDDD